MTQSSNAIPVSGEPVNVVAWAYSGPRGGLIAVETKPKHAPEARPLVALSDYEQMRRERDEYAASCKQLGAIVEHNVARAETAEAEILTLRATKGELVEALTRIAAPYDGEDGRMPVPLVKIGQELRDRQKIARTALSRSGVSK